MGGFPIDGPAALYNLNLYHIRAGAFAAEKILICALPKSGADQLRQAPNSKRRQDRAPTTPKSRDKTPEKRSPKKKKDSPANRRMGNNPQKKNTKASKKPPN